MYALIPLAVVVGLAICPILTIGVLVLACIAYFGNS